MSGAILMTGIHATGTSLNKVTIIQSEETTTTHASFQSEEIAPVTSFSDLLKVHWWKFLISLLVLSSIITWAAYKLVKIKHAQANPDPGVNDFQFLEENLLYTLIDNMPDFIYIKDAKSRFIISNQKIANVHGIKSPRLMKGKTDYDFYPRELANKFYWDEQEIIASGKPLINLEEKGLNEKGEGIYLSTTKIPLRNNQGEVIGIVGIGRDITARKKVEEKLVEHAEELQQANTLLEEKQEEIYQQSEELVVQAESLSLANLELEKLSIVARETDNVVIILDNEGNFEWVNSSFTKVYGASLEEFVKQKGRNLIESSFNP
ncbi:MAG: PAS domain-containing protein, partial [Bacteroidales bacterium]|nr:PAS domain-containing protein [Bacteroidales bacterium]